LPWSRLAVPSEWVSELAAVASLPEPARPALPSLCVGAGAP
jgi:hypothetical protein